MLPRKSPLMRRASHLRPSAQLFSGRQMSRFFDAEWYSGQYGVAVKSALKHFLNHGDKVGYDPNPDFDTDWYRYTYPDAPAPGAGNAYRHFLANRTQGRQPNPRFDPTWYLKTYPDIANAGPDAYEHYLRYGKAEQRAPNPTEMWFRKQSAHQAIEEPLPSVTIVIPVHGQWQATERCLRALAASEAKLIADVIVVDDASPDDTLRHLNRYPWVTVLRNETNLGYLRSTNLGARATLNDYVLLLNNDTEPLPGFLYALIQTMKQDPAIALVGSRLTYTNGTMQEAGSIIWSDGTGHNYGNREHVKDLSYSFSRDVDYCSAASLLVDREFFMKEGGFDEIYSPAYYEDTDLAFRARSQGRRVVYQPHSVVFHYEGVSHGTDITQGVKAFQTRNLALFRSRWHRELRQQPRPDEVPFQVARSRDWRPVVLFVRWAVPTPRQDAGSVRAMKMMEILQDLGYSVAFFCPNVDPHSVEAQEFQSAGGELLIDPDVVRKYLLDVGWWVSAVVYSHVGSASKWGPILNAVKPQRGTVYDTVDIHHLREGAEAALCYDSLGQVRADVTKLLELQAIDAADVTVVVSPSEKEYLATLVTGKRVEVISTIHEVAPNPVPWHPRSGLVFVGGFQHPPNLDGIIWFLSDVWPLLDPDIQDAGIDIVGGPKDPALRHFESNLVRVHGFVPKTEPFLSTARLSVAPLRYGAGVKGKVGEAWSIGLPVAATHIALDGMANGEEILGSSCDAQEMADLINRLYKDEQLWTASQSQGIRIVQEKLSRDAARDTWSKILSDLQGPKDPAVVKECLSTGKLVPTVMPRTD
jgi:O-antigen biosynthesis protein